MNIGKFCVEKDAAFADKTKFETKFKQFSLFPYLKIWKIEIKLVLRSENVTFLPLVDDYNSAFKHKKTDGLYLACTAYSVTR